MHRMVTSVSGIDANSKFSDALLILKNFRYVLSNTMKQFLREEFEKFMFSDNVTIFQAQKYFGWLASLDSWAP